MFGADVVTVCCGSHNHAYEVTLAVATVDDTGHISIAPRLIAVTKEIWSNRGARAIASWNP